jgi:hypothetical protein
MQYAATKFIVKLGPVLLRFDFALEESPEE